MSDYSAPNKSIGENWTAEEHNDMKEAINSKMDKSNLKNDLDTPLSTTFPSTQLLAAILANKMTHRGEINGMSNVNLCILPGYYTSTAPSGGTWHSSFPATVPEDLCKVGLLVYSVAGFLNQELTLYLERPRVFKRVFTDGEFSEWVEYMTISIAASEFAPAVTDGIPTVVLEDDPPGFDIFISPATRDVGGVVTITNVAANPPPYIEFKVNFQHSRPKITSVVLTAGNNTAMDGKMQTVLHSAAGFKAKISANIPVGGTSVIHFGVIQNQ